MLLNLRDGKEMTVMRFVDLRHLQEKPYFYYHVAGWVYKSYRRQIVLYSR